MFSFEKYHFSINTIQAKNTRIILWVLLVYLCTEICTKITERSDISGNIVNGVDVPITMYSYMAQISVSGFAHCGGSVISQRVILTAAHCIGKRECLYRWYPYTNITVYLGSSKSLKGKKYNVCKTLPYPNYGGARENDIGLILLKKKIVFGPKVQMAKLTPNTQWKKEANYVAVIGFGNTGTKGPGSKTLKMMKLKYVSKNICAKTQHGPEWFYSNMSLQHSFCLIGEHWTGTCYGDSGSPVVWKRTVVGLVSGLRDAFCASDMMPTIYTDVAHFNKWIKYNVKFLESENHTCMRRSVDYGPTDKYIYRYRYLNQILKLVNS